jgi:hypothetical protein
MKLCGSVNWCLDTEVTEQNESDGFALRPGQAQTQYAALSDFMDLHAGLGRRAAEFVPGRV